jgi:hypothetical protein
MGHLLKIKCVDSRVNVHTLSSTSVPFTLTTVQVPNLALTHTKRLPVQGPGQQAYLYEQCYNQQAADFKFDSSGSTQLLSPSAAL